MRKQAGISRTADATIALGTAVRGTTPGNS